MKDIMPESSEYSRLTTESGWEDNSESEWEDNTNGLRPILRSVMF